MYAERSLDGPAVQLVWSKQRVGVDGQREEATGGRLGAVPERNRLPHRPSHGPQTCSCHHLWFFVRVTCSFSTV